MKNSLEYLYCYGNKLSYFDLEGYNKWYEENKELIDRYDIKDAHEMLNQTNNYNL